MTHNLDLTLYNQACNAFNQQDYRLALDLINQFKATNRLDDLSQLPYEQAFFEILVSFEFGRANQASENLNYVLLVGNKLLANNGLNNECVMQINIVMGECYLLLDNLNDALRVYSNVINLDGQQQKKPIWFKLLCLLGRHGGYTNKLKELAKITVNWEMFRIPTHFVLLNSAISSLDKKTADEQILVLKSDLAILDLEQQIRLFQACVKISEYALAKEIFDASQMTKENYNKYDQARANLAFHNKNYDETLSILNNIQHDVLDVDSHNVLYLKAKAYDKNKDYAQAFSNFTEAAKYKDQNNTKVQQASNIYIADYPQLYKSVDFRAINNLHIRELAAYDGRSPTFLLGFPRSGTTLLDTVLDTQPSLIVLSERATIFSVTQEMFRQFGKSYPQQLAELTPEEISILRQVYFDAVSEFANNDLAHNSSIIVDKMPLNTQHIPLILILFPKAKFIFSVRHPLDCLISTWQQNLLFDSEFNAEMTFLSTMEKITKKYTDVLNHFEQCEEYFDLNIHFIKYENLVENFEKEVASLLAFLAISNVNNDYLKFSEHAKTKIINTPSRDQVTKGIYKGSLFGWKRYESYLTEEFKTLTHFIDKFNYKH